MRHAEGASAVRSAAKHRSDSVARSTPTRAQRGTRPKRQMIKMCLHKSVNIEYIC
ncbi:MAG: hypothetical protein NZ455_00385 [Bacteroidia bacterium]|nr:hypothetical protein [Bacteroidia bacterium]